MRHPAIIGGIDVDVDEDVLPAQLHAPVRGIVAPKPRDPVAEARAMWSDLHRSRDAIVSIWKLAQAADDDDEKRRMFRMLMEAVNQITHADDPDWESPRGFKAKGHFAWEDEA